MSLDKRNKLIYWLSMNILIFGLATWRIASLLVREEGPFHVFEKFREWSGIRHGLDGEIELIPPNLLAGILSCVWCCSIWVAFGLWIFHFIFPIAATWFATALSLSAVAIVFDKFVKPT